MACETSDDRIVSISEEPENGEWLINIMKGQDPKSRPKPLIQRVARTLREIESNKACFDPLVVSFGPYHHDEERLQPMEPYKEAAARWFVSLASNDKPVDTITDMEVKNVYKKFVIKATSKSSPRECYADKFLCKFQINDFMRIMFLDGCFILHFINLFQMRSDELLNSSHLNASLIARDMFLLENQIPYSILNALMSLILPKSIEIEEFINRVFLIQHEPLRLRSELLTGAIKLFKELFSNPKENEGAKGGGSKSVDTEKKGEHFHLLDFLRSKLIGEDDKDPNRAPKKNASSYYYFRSIMELKTAGIKLRRSKSNCLKDIKFKKDLIHGFLQLPQLMVDDATKTRLLNLIAYEMCPDGHSDRAVISYICFLDSLIDRAEDVKELRSKNILLNRLGSDEEVANLFNEVANYLTPNCRTYSDVMKGIESHINSHVTVWIAEFMHTHFASPWTVLALMAAIFVIVLTVVQTGYGIADYYKKEK